jgi:hypothetical protein
MLGVHFEPSCQRRNQAGSLDPACPGTTFNPWAARPTYQAGCCRADAGVCGYQLDVAGDMQLDLGCVSAAAFASTPPIPCGPAVRPYLLSCFCGENSETVQFCLAVDCGVSAANHDICIATCAARGGSHGWSCETASPVCR